jgi:hypothetical protein
MEIICEYLVSCGFFKKHEQSKALACKGLISLYCKGPKLIDCKRLEYLELHGKLPSPDLMPNGHMMMGTKE